MRLAQLAVLPLACSLCACGAEIAAPSSEGAPAPHATGDGDGAGAGSAADTGTSGVIIGPKTIVGELGALTENVNDQTLQVFSIDLQERPPRPTFDGATRTLGSCGYFAPVPRPGTQPPGQGGSPATESSAGTLTLSNVTSSAPIDRFDYQGGGYSHAPANYWTPVWQPGDLLRVNAAGAEIGPFAVTATVLTLPITQVPSPIARTQDLTITWQPDANAETVMLTLLDGGTGAVVACSAPDSAGTLTVDASLLAEFASDTRRLDAVTERWATRYVQTPTGRVAFTTTGWFNFDATLD